MAGDCANVPSSIRFNCTYPWGWNCTSEKGFDFISLWNYTQSIQKACPNDNRLFITKGNITTPENAALAQESCIYIAGSDWRYYPGADIWTRLTTWKMPLLQLIASFPRPPLDFWVECIIITHLLGDPIDTIRSLLLKLSACQTLADHWRAESRTLFGTSAKDGRDRDWKALAIVTDAYAEWSEDNRARVSLREALSQLTHDSEEKTKLRAVIHQTADALAADRATKFLPIVVAQCFFIGAVGIAIARTASAADSSASSDTVFINVEAHSIAFSAQYFWVIPAVFLGSVIGVSQTEAAIPRILRRFQHDLDTPYLSNKIQLLNKCLENKRKRIFYGGVYSWQPSSWYRKFTNSGTSRASKSSNPPSLESSRARNYPSAESAAYRLTEQHQPAGNEKTPLQQRWIEGLHVILPYLIVIVGSVTGILVSALVPPDGWECRHIAQVLILTVWLLSAVSDMILGHLLPLNDSNQSFVFWITGIKDLLATLSTMGGVVATQVGVFNRCSCYTRWGNTGLALPHMPDVANVLRHRLSTVYPAITFTCIGIELLVVPLYVCIRYNHALRVFLQRDDQTSNAAWVWDGYTKCYALSTRVFRSLFPRSHHQWRPKRAGTGAIEEGSDNPVAIRLFDEPEEAPVGDESTPVTNEYHVQGQPGEEIMPTSQTSGLEVPSRSGSITPSTMEPRRRITDPLLGSTEDDQASVVGNR